MQVAGAGTTTKPAVTPAAKPTTKPSVAAAAKPATGAATHAAGVLGAIGAGVASGAAHATAGASSANGAGRSAKQPTSGGGSNAPTGFWDNKEVVKQLDRGIGTHGPDREPRHEFVGAGSPAQQGLGSGAKQLDAITPAQKAGLATDQAGLAGRLDGASDAQRRTEQTGYYTSHTRWVGADGTVYRARYDAGTDTVRRERTESGTTKAGAPVTVTRRVDAQGDGSAVSSVDQRVARPTTGEYDRTVQKVSTDASGAVTGTQAITTQARRATDLDVPGATSKSGLRVSTTDAQSNADGHVVASRTAVDERTDDGSHRAQEQQQRATSFDAQGRPLTVNSTSTVDVNRTAQGPDGSVATTYVSDHFDGGTTTYTYDDAGRVTSTSDVRDVSDQSTAPDGTQRSNDAQAVKTTTTNTYDRRGRLTGDDVVTSGASTEAVTTPDGTVTTTRRPASFTTHQRDSFDATGQVRRTSIDARGHEDQTIATTGKPDATTSRDVTETSTGTFDPDGRPLTHAEQSSYSGSAVVPDPEHDGQTKHVQVHGSAKTDLTSAYDASGNLVRQSGSSDGSDTTVLDKGVTSTQTQHLTRSWGDGTTPLQGPDGAAIAGAPRPKLTLDQTQQVVDPRGGQDDGKSFTSTTTTHAASGADGQLKYDDFSHTKQVNDGDDGAITTTWDTPINAKTGAVRPVPKDFHSPLEKLGFGNADKLRTAAWQMQNHHEDDKRSDWRTFEDGAIQVLGVVGAVAGTALLFTGVGSVAGAALLGVSLGAGALATAGTVHEAVTGRNHLGASDVGLSAASLIPGAGAAAARGGAAIVRTGLAAERLGQVATGFEQLGRATAYGYAGYSAGTTVAKLATGQSVTPLDALNTLAALGGARAAGLPGRTGGARGAAGEPGATLPRVGGDTPVVPVDPSLPAPVTPIRPGAGELPRLGEPGTTPNAGPGRDPIESPTPRSTGGAVPTEPTVSTAPVRPVSPGQVARTGDVAEVSTQRQQEAPYGGPGLHVTNVAPGRALDISTLDPKQSYLWVVDAKGNFLLSQEHQPGFRRTVKHGDLVPSADGRFRGAARAGGELHNVDGHWVIDNQSSYSYARARYTSGTPSYGIPYGGRVVHDPAEITDLPGSTADNLAGVIELLRAGGTDTRGLTGLGYDGTPVLLGVDGQYHAYPGATGAAGSQFAQPAA